MCLKALRCVLNCPVDERDEWHVNGPQVRVDREVTEGGAAAGLIFKGDQMCAVNGTPVTDHLQWGKLASGAVGDVVFSIMRGGDFTTVTVTKPDAATKLGVVVENMPSVGIVKYGINGKKVA